MSNDYYNPTGAPTAHTDALAEEIQAEFDLIKTGVEKLPVLAGNPSLPVFVNAGATALESKSAASALSVLGAASLASPAFTGNPMAPTAAQFDNDTSIASTAFVNRAGFHFQAVIGTEISTPTTVPLSQSGHWYQVTAGPVTLPALSTTTAGLATYTFKAAGASGFQLIGDSGELISSGAGVNNIYTAAAGECFTVVANTTAWFVIMNGFGTASMALKANLASPTLTGAPAAPTAAFGTNSTQIATTAFAQAAGFHFPVANGIGIAGNTTLTAANANKWYEVQNAGITVTLPTLASVNVGMTYTLKAVYNFILQGNGSETINSFAGVATGYLVLAGQTVTVVSNGSSWYTISEGFGSKSFEASDNLQRLPGGYILQTGTFTSHAVRGNPVAVSFPINFPVTCLGINLTVIGATTSDGFAWYDTPSVAGFNGRCSLLGNPVYYEARGR